MKSYLIKFNTHSAFYRDKDDCDSDTDARWSLLYINSSLRNCRAVRVDTCTYVAIRDLPLVITISEVLQRSAFSILWNSV